MVLQDVGIELPDLIGIDPVTVIFLSIAELIEALGLFP